MDDTPHLRWRILPGGVTHDSALLRIQAPRATGRTHAPPVLSFDPPPPVGWTQALDPEPSQAEFAVRLTGLQADTAYRVTCEAEGSTLASDAWIRTAPARIGDGAGLLIGVTSCYYPSPDFWTLPQHVGDCLKRRDWRPPGAPPPMPGFGGKVPAAFFHLGDQIYADVSGALSGDIERLYQGRYEKNWAPDRLGAVLCHGGHFFTPDDHEYWNGFPAPMIPWLPRTWGSSWEQLATTARSTLWREQGRWNFVRGFSGGESDLVGWGSGSLGEIPLFITDSRSDRTGPSGERRPEDLARRRPPTGKQPSLLSSSQRQALLQWLALPDPVGVLVLSQPLLASGSRLVDTGLEHYKDDYDALLSALGDAVTAGKTLIVLTGDIHTGRLTRFAPKTGGPGQLIEFVVSPLARIGSSLPRKVANLLNEQSRVGPAKKVDTVAELQESDAARRLRTAWPGLDLHCHFATSQNQFGLLHFFADSAGQRIARFEIWNLNEIEPAGNDWSPKFTCERNFVIG